MDLREFEKRLKKSIIVQFSHKKERKITKKSKKWLKPHKVGILLHSEI
jgi:hypothetical protein